jgi:hypothetical protein
VLETCLSEVAALSFDEMSRDDAAAWFGALTTLSNAVSAARSACGLRLSLLDAHVASGFRDEVSSFASGAGVSRAEARRSLEAASVASSSPEVSAVVRSGALSPEQASLVARAMRVDPSAEARLLSMASRQPIAVLAEEVRRLEAACSAREQARRDEALRSRRRCRISTTNDGMVSLYALLAPEEDAVVKSRLDRLRDELFRARHHKGLKQSFDANCADAFVALMSRSAPPAGAGDAGAAEPSGSDDDDDGDSGKSRAGGGRATNRKRRRTKRNVDVTVLVDWSALTRGHLEPGETCEIAGVGPVSVTTARELLGDSMFRILVTDGRDVKAATSPKRHWPAEVRAALTFRDQRCANPHCDSSFRLEIDHVERFSDGGPTSYDNARRLCPSCHRKLSQGFRLVGEPDDYRWLAPGEIDWLDTG